jgi:hypothetical protein
VTATYTEDKVTPVSRDEAAKAFHWALDRRAPEIVALAMAQWALETGRGKYCHSYNAGNIKANIDTYDGMFTCFPCNEILGGKTVWFEPQGQVDHKGGSLVGKKYEVPPGHPQTRFRAYPNLFVGIEDYVEFLKRPSYAKAWVGLLSGNAGHFVGALKAARYFTADEGPYLKAVLSLQREFESVLIGRPHEEQEVDDGLRATLVRTEEQWVHVPGYDLGLGWRDSDAEEDTEPDGGRKA